jgi:lambda repressor-like predicted transcriptional regulator
MSSGGFHARGPRIGPLADAIRRWQAETGYSLMTLAARARVSHRTLERIVTGTGDRGQRKILVAWEQADRICLGIGVHPVQLWGVDEWHGPSRRSKRRSA